MGNETVNTVPLPTSLFTSIVPFMALTTPWTIANPIPKPGTLLSFPTRINGEKMVSILSFGIPCPVSSTLMTSLDFSCTIAFTCTLPFAVYFMALVTMFSMICITLDGSLFIYVSEIFPKLTETLLLFNIEMLCSTVSCTILRKLNDAIFISTLPLSTLANSARSFI
ncbi:hypothetical protein D3C75_1000240 [compost metagenome]